MKNSLNNLPYDLLSGTVSFFFPSKIVGGHELMALELMKELMKRSISLKVIFIAQNTELRERIIRAGIHADFLCLNIKQPRLELFHATFNLLYLREVDIAINKINAFSQGSTVIVQGDIELGSAFIKSAYKKHIELYSYVPYAHTAKKMGKAFHIIRDLLYPSYYKKINKYITISNKFKNDLKKYNENADVIVIENKVRCLDSIKELIRNNRVLRKDKFEIALVGRISFKQKGHDILVHALAMLESHYIQKIKLHIVGDGRDRIKLDAAIKRMCPTLEVIYHGWSKEPWEKIYNTDLVIIPSRFEGVPLVMLEAIELEIDILATNTDGMVDYLSTENLFENTCDLSKKISQRVSAAIRNNYLNSHNCEI